MRRSTRAFAALTLLTAIAGLVGCAPAAATLAGRDFLSVAVTENGADRPLVPGTRISLGFSDGKVAIAAGCNAMGGEYRIDGGRLVVDSLAMTDMGCDADRMTQDQWLATFLGTKPVVRLSGSELVLESGSAGIRLQDRTIVNPDKPLVGPTWTVTSIIDNEAVSSVPAGATATLVFGADGGLTVNSGCNDGHGTWKAVAGGLEISGLAMTKKACIGPGAQLEDAVVAVLGSGTVAASIRADVLTLQSAGKGLQLQAR